MLFFHRTPASFCAQDGLTLLNDSYSVLLHDPLNSLWHMPYLLYIIHNTALKTELFIYFLHHSSISQLFCNIWRLEDYWAQSQKLQDSPPVLHAPPLPFCPCHLQRYPMQSSLSHPPAFESCIQPR